MEDTRKYTGNSEGVAANDAVCGGMGYDPVLHEGRSGVKLTSMVKTSGCAAKLPPGKLHHVIDSLPLMSSDRLLEGFESADDALVYSVDNDTVSVQTVDFFPPMVDDPYTFGQVAAANALSDIYAMGGEPNVAMNLVCFPSCLELDVLRSILLGGMDKVREAGAIIAGGHTIADPTPKYGLCVTAFMKRNEVRSNKGAKVGDCVVLTKALGVGMMNTAAKAGEATESDFAAAISSMTTLNKHARDLARDLEVHAATDITGFSLSGHLSECADASNTTIEVSLGALPILPGALDAARFGFIPEGRYTNEDYLFSKVSFPSGTPMEYKDIAFGPETSGGLALFMSHDDALHFVSRMGLDCVRIIGSVVPRTDVSVAYVE